MDQPPIVRSYLKPGKKAEAENAIKPERKRRRGD